MKVVVIGLGSMGKRRIRLMKQHGMVDEIYGIDSRSDRRSEVEANYDIRTFSGLSEALAFDSEICGALVCTAPLSHAMIIRQCLENDLHVFTEINLINDGYQENLALAAAKGKTLFLSSSFLYREEIRHITEKVHRHDQPLRYIYHIGQYLPDWHPWENYTDFFVGDKRTNGCREIFAIELPWLLHAFGTVTNVSTTHSKAGALALNYDDNYMVQLTHENGTVGMLCVDVLSPKAVRNLEIFGEKFYLSWNGTPTGLSSFNGSETVAITFDDAFEHQKGYQATIVENMYANELRSFFEVVNGTSKPLYGFEKDAVVLDLIDRIEE